ncbi:MAG: hypothetical protein WCT36_05625, partial [Candidatus Gracilibacteria bacterium]
MAKAKKKKFKLRPVKKGDELSIYNNINNKKIIDNLSVVPYPYTLKDARDWVKKSLKRQAAKVVTDFVLAVDIDGDVVGSIGLHR